MEQAEAVDAFLGCLTDDLCREIAFEIHGMEDPPDEDCAARLAGFLVWKGIPRYLTGQLARVLVVVGRGSPVG